MAMKSRTWTALGLALALAGCTAQAPADTGKAPPELVLQGVGFKFFRGSELTTVGHARSASFRSDTGDLGANRVKLRFLRPPENDMILEAGTASGNIRTKQADAENGVLLVDAEGTTVRTTKSHIDGNTRLATATDPVEVTGAGFRSQASGGFALELGGSRTLVFHGPVTSTLEDMRGMP